MEARTTVTVHEPTRAAEYQRIFGSATVPVKSFFPTLANLPGFKRPLEVYLLDLDKITTDQRGRLASHIAERFGLNSTEVNRDLDRHGVPIRAEHCSAASSDPALFFTMIDDLDT